ncbi:MAG: RNA polymerase sigma factor [Longimicrobiales bacterium]
MPRITDLRDRMFERDVLECLPDVARFARSLARDESDADDLVQETILLAYRGYHTFRAGDEPRRWLFTICRHIFIRQRQRAARFSELDDLGDPPSETMRAVYGHIAAQVDGSASRLETMDVRPAIDNAIANLPLDFRIVVVLVDLEGLSYADAAESLGIPVGTVRSRLYRGRRLLQEQLLAFAGDAGIERAIAKVPAPTSGAL